MQTENQRERLVDLLRKSGASFERALPEEIADYLMSNNVVVLPCVVYNKSHERYQVIRKGKDGRIFASNLYHTRKAAENVLKERKENVK